MVIEKLSRREKPSNNKRDAQWMFGYVGKAGLKNQRPGSSLGSGIHVLQNRASLLFLKPLLLEMKAIIIVSIF